MANTRADLPQMVRGNFQDYEADKMRRLGTDSIISHRVKYKRFKG
jgi:hypothetical protein